MRCLRTISLFICCGFVMLGISVAGVMAQQDKKLDLRVTTNKTIYQLDEQVQLTILLRNVGDEPIQVTEPAIDRRSIRIEIVEPGGEKDDLIAIQGLKLEKVRLIPGKRIRFNTDFLPEQLGKHTINVHYQGFELENIVASGIDIFVVKRRD